MIIRMAASSLMQIGERRRLSAAGWRRGGENRKMELFSMKENTCPAQRMRGRAFLLSRKGAIRRSDPWSEFGCSVVHKEAQANASKFYDWLFLNPSCPLCHRSLTAPAHHQRCDVLTSIPRVLRLLRGAPAWWQGRSVQYEPCYVRLSPCGGHQPELSPRLPDRFSFSLPTDAGRTELHDS